MRSSMLFGSLILLLLLLASVHGRLDMQLLAALHNKEEIPGDFKWQRPPSSSRRPADMRRASDGSGGTASEHHLTSRAPAAAEEDGEVKKMMRVVHREVAPRLIHEDYSGPNGHSPNHHRTIPCGRC